MIIGGVKLSFKGKLVYIIDFITRVEKDFGLRLSFSKLNKILNIKNLL